MRGGRFRRPARSPGRRRWRDGRWGGEGPRRSGGLECGGTLGAWGAGLAGNAASGTARTDVGRGPRGTRGQACGSAGRPRAGRERRAGRGPSEALGRRRGKACGMAERHRPGRNRGCRGVCDGAQGRSPATCRITGGKGWRQWQGLDGPAGRVGAARRRGGRDDAALGAVRQTGRYRGPESLGRPSRVGAPDHTAESGGADGEGGRVSRRTRGAARRRASRDDSAGGAARQAGRYRGPEDRGRRSRVAEPDCTTKSGVADGKGGEFPAGRAGPRGVVESGTLPEGGSGTTRRGSGATNETIPGSGVKDRRSRVAVADCKVEGGGWTGEGGRGTRRTPRRKRGAASRGRPARVGLR